MKNGHFVRFCRVKKFFVPNGILIGVPKNSKDSNDRINANGPKFVRGLNLVT